MAVSVRELKTRLSEYLRRAQAGEEIQVTSHGRVVGRLIGPAVEDDPLSRLRAQPWLRKGDGARVRGAAQPAHVPAGTVDELMQWVHGE